MSKGFCGDGVRVAYPLFQAGGGGSIPTSPLRLTLEEIDFTEAKKLNRLWHSRLPRIGDPESIMEVALCFGVEFDGRWYATAIWSHPVAQSLPQDRWLELRRLAIAPDAPRNTASRTLAIMARLVRRKRPGVVRLISYQDTEVHTGGIYRAAGWTRVVQQVKSNTQWNMPGRSRPLSQSVAPKVRWEKYVGNDIKWTELNPPEKSRTYTFPDGRTLTVEGVVRIERRDSGTHRLETNSGRKLFVNPAQGWSLDIDVPEWTC